MFCMFRILSEVALFIYLFIYLCTFWARFSHPSAKSVVLAEQTETLADLLSHPAVPPNKINIHQGFHHTLTKNKEIQLIYVQSNVFHKTQNIPSYSLDTSANVLQKELLNWHSCFFHSI